MELLLVVLILAVLASIVIPRIAESSGDAKQAKCDSNVANLIRAVEQRAKRIQIEFVAALLVVFLEVEVVRDEPDAVDADAVGACVVRHQRLLGLVIDVIVHLPYVQQ